MHKSLPNTLRVRPVEFKDADALAELYRRLDSCNGSDSREKVMSIIKETRDFLDGPETGAVITIQSLTYVAEIIGEDNPNKGKIVGTGGLLKVEDDPETNPVMYMESDDGIELKQMEIEASGCVEFGGMVVAEGYEGTSVGKAISVMRALVARKFAGLFGSDQILSEFLPEYDDNVTKENAFWTELILPELKKSGVLEALKAECSQTLGEEITTDTQLCTAMVKKLNAKDRNRLVLKYFPKKINGDEINLKAQEAKGRIGNSSAGTKINLERIFVPNSFPIAGYFPIDGGPCHTSETQYSALADRTVKLVYGEREGPDKEVMKQGPEIALVMPSVKHIVHGLKNLTGIATSGTFAHTVAKLPHAIEADLGIPEGYHVTFHKLPTSSSHKKE